MATKTEICQMALSHLGNGRPITDIDTDSTNEADTIRQFYDVVQNQMLREYRWGFSKTVKTLNKSHDGYGLDLDVAALSSTTDYSDNEVLLTSIDTDVIQHIDVVVSTVLSGASYVTVTLEGGPSGFASATTIQTIGTFSPTAAVGTRLTAEIKSSDLSYAAYRLKFTSTTTMGGAFSAFMAEETGSPTDEWAYSYEYPADCLYAIRIGGASRQDAYDTKIQYTRYHRPKSLDAGDSTYTPTQQILTDEDDACLEYVTNEFLQSGNSTEQIYPDDFAMALSLRVAIAIAPRITGGDNGFLVQTLWSKYDSEVSRARANDANELGAEVPLDSELIRARE